MKILGMMAGTSLDGIDAALCDIQGSGADLKAELLAFECLPYQRQLRERLMAACDNKADVRDIARLNVEVGEAFAAVAQKVFGKHGRADLIASHGQTISHLPDNHASLQIGEGAVIAERTGVTVVCNFRARDLAAGGQGAPLVPYADWVLLRHPHKNRVILNIGGIANCTILPANCALSDVRAWDTGPGNMPIDLLVQRMYGIPCDKNGELAARGVTAPFDVLAVHPFFALHPPKTAGREQFGHNFVMRQFTNLVDEYDNIAHLTAVSARSIADSIARFSDFAPGDYELIVGGGGTHNKTLMKMLAEEVAPAPVLRHEDVGLQSDAKEALAFAILGSETLRGVPTNVTGATGASHPCVLGQVIPSDNFAALSRHDRG